MSEKTLHNPHLKENPFEVPPGYFEQVEARWAYKAVDTQQGQSPGVFAEGYDAGGSLPVAESGSLPVAESGSLPVAEGRLLPIAEGNSLPVAEGRFRRIIRLLKPQMQLAAAFVLLFGIGSFLLFITSRSQKTETEEFSIFGELSYWGMDHRVVSDLILEDFPGENNASVLADLDVDELIDYLDYPGLDLADFNNNTNNE